jgi:hypothetical protein
MTRHFTLGGAVAGALVAAITWAGEANADTTVVEQPAAPAPVVATPVVATPATAERAPYTGPNRMLIESGLITFGLSYIPAVIVAGTSDTSADHHLYVPVIGPWLDLGNRPSCGVGAIGCDTETTNKVLLVVDGIFQGLGVLTTVGGFLTPEHREVVTTADAKKLTLHLTPTQIASGAYGMAAFGTF